MALSDLLADVITRIRNGQMAGHSIVITPSSNLVKSVLDVMIKESYIKGYEEFEQSKGIMLLKVDLKYHQGQPVITFIQKVSKPGRRIYSQIKKLKKYYGGLGISIISTSKGVMSDEEARKLRLGGEVLCNVY